MLSSLLLPRGDTAQPEPGRKCPKQEDRNRKQREDVGTELDREAGGAKRRPEGAPRVASPMSGVLVFDRPEEPVRGTRQVDAASRCQERCDLLREVDAIFIEELHRRKLYDEIWQAFCVLLPVQSVGVTGDSRNYGDVVAMRAIASRDGMTADVYPFEMQDLLEISSRITNSVRKVGRVVYDVSSKPPATIEWE